MATLRRTGNTFALEVGEWCLEMKDYTKIVWQTSVIRLVMIMQRPVSQGGRMPVMTGFLRSSLMCGTSPIAAASVPRPNDEGGYLYFPNRIEDAVRAAKVGQRIYLAYLAEYAFAQEYGWGGQPGRGFMRLAIQMWPNIVATVSAELAR